MSKTAFVILAAGDTHESLGRVVNAFMGALEYAKENAETKIIFDGAGTQAAAEFAKSNHKYHELFEQVREQIEGACSYCANAFEVKDKLTEAKIELIDEFKGHPSFKKLIDDGYNVLVF